MDSFSTIKARLDQTTCSEFSESLDDFGAHDSLEPIFDETTGSAGDENIKTDRDQFETVESVYHQVGVGKKIFRNILLFLVKK
jgi:hypothetical protein